MTRLRLNKKNTSTHGKWVLKLPLFLILCAEPNDVHYEPTSPYQASTTILMKKAEMWEGVVLLLAAVLLLPIWLAQSGKVEFPPTIFTILEYLRIPLILVLAVILVRRVRRVINAMRENKNRPGPF